MRKRKKCVKCSGPAATSIDGRLHCREHAAAMRAKPITELATKVEREMSIPIAAPDTELSAKKSWWRRWFRYICNKNIWGGQSSSF